MKNENSFQPSNALDIPMVNGEIVPILGTYTAPSIPQLAVAYID